MDMYKICHDAKFECGGISIGDPYPFSGKGIPEGCGRPDLRLSCHDGAAMIEFNQGLGRRYDVKDINPDNRTLRIARQDFKNDLCNPEPEDLIFAPTDLFNDSFPGYVHVTLLYDCPVGNGTFKSFNCDKEGAHYHNVSFERLLGMPPSPGDCSASVTVLLQIPLPGNDYQSVLTSLNEGTVVQWMDTPECQKCRETHGICGFELYQTVCYCRNHQGYFSECPQGMDL
ncbi:hypothetical protein CCACVL1_13090 [Corchorus capsularis]|uniref:non-specific serine/threonine protein kinase n=1 Tax=Corchorus capsularis TaxID=210143 RepID=A0A1R3ICH3_COCAP|nr:hypothetical protein CCACVL1_13090 [Corchorus capsularis]